MPALADVLLAHADADARADLVAGDGRRQQLRAGHVVLLLGHGKQRRERDGADVQHALSMHVVELEGMHLRAVDQRRIRGRQPQAGPPYRRAVPRLIDAGERIADDPAPRQVDAVERAPERVEHQQLDALAHVSRDPVERQPGDELRDGAGVDVVDGSVVAHGLVPALSFDWDAPF